MIVCLVSWASGWERPGLPHSEPAGHRHRRAGLLCHPGRRRTQLGRGRHEILALRRLFHGCAGQCRERLERGAALLAGRADGKPLTNDLSQAIPLSIPLEMGTPVASTEVKLQVDLPSDNAMIGQQAAIPPTAASIPATRRPMPSAPPFPMYGPDGKPEEAEAYFIKVAAPDAPAPTRSMKCACW